jgi:hypothetical protein
MPLVLQRDKLLRTPEGLARRTVGVEDCRCCSCIPEIPPTFDAGLLVDGLIDVSCVCAVTGCGYAYENLGPQATIDVEQAWPTVADPPSFDIGVPGGVIVCSTFETSEVQINLRFKAYGQAYLGRRHQYTLNATKVFVSGIPKLHIEVEHTWENTYRSTWGAAYDRRYRFMYDEWNPNSFAACAGGERTTNHRFGAWTDYNTFVDLSTLDYLLPYWTPANPLLPDTICRGDNYVISEAPSVVWNWVTCLEEGNADLVADPACPFSPYPFCYTAGSGVEWGSGPSIGYVDSHQQGAWGYFEDRDWGNLTICGEDITDEILDYFELADLEDPIIDPFPEDWYPDPVTQFDQTWGSKPAIGLFKDPLNPTDTSVNGLVNQGTLNYEGYIDCPLELDSGITLDLVGTLPVFPDNVTAKWGAFSWSVTRFNDGGEENYGFTYSGVDIPANPYVAPATLTVTFKAAP